MRVDADNVRFEEGLRCVRVTIRGNSGMYNVQAHACVVEAGRSVSNHTISAE